MPPSPIPAPQPPSRRRRALALAWAVSLVLGALPTVGQPSAARAVPLHGGRVSTDAQPTPTAAAPPHLPRRGEAPPPGIPEPASPATPASPSGSPAAAAAKRVEQGLRALGAWAPVGFIAVFILACVLCVPVVVFTLAAGALFGTFWGFCYAWMAAQIGASLAFLISRRLAHDWVSRRLARRPVLSAINEVIGTDGWMIVGLMRLAPGSPFFVLNYLFGVTRVRYRDYVLATAVSIIPGTLFFVYLGSLGQQAASGQVTTFWDWGLRAAGLGALALACTLIARRARRLLRQRLDPQGSD